MSFLNYFLVPSRIEARNRLGWGRGSQCLAAMIAILLFIPGTLSAAESGYVYVPVVTMNDVSSADVVKFNSWGGDKKAACKIVKDDTGKFNRLIRLFYSNSKSTLSVPQLNDFIANKIDSNPISGVYLWYRTSNTHGASWIEYNDGNRFANKFGLKSDNAWRKLKLSLGGWNKNKQSLDIKKLQTANFVFIGSGVIDIGEIGVFYKYDTSHVKLQRLAYMLKSFLETKTKIVVDGTINADEWSGAEVIPALQSGMGKLIETNNKTVSYVKASESGLYCGIRCFKNDMSKLKADITSNSVRIYEDESVEFYLDDGRTTRNFKKIAVNANGCIGGVTNAYEKSGLLVSAKKYADRWELEILFPWRFISEKKLIPSVMGFNITRNCYDSGTIERTGWSTTVWNAVDKFGVMEFLKNTSVETVASTIKPVLRKIGDDGYILLYHARDLSSQVRVSVDTPMKKRYAFRKSYKTSKKGEFAVPFRIPLRKSGYYHIGILINPDSRIQNYWEVEESKELYTSLVPLNINKLALFPVPKIFVPKPGSTKLNSNLKIFAMKKENELGMKIFISDLKRFYGIDISYTKSLKDADIIVGLGSNPSIRNLMKKLNFTKEYDKIRHDGFALYVDKGVILVTAKESRGLFYGVNVLLDLVKKSSSEVGPAEIRHCRVVDWAQAQIRFFHQMMQSYYHYTKYDPKFFCDMLYKFPMRFRFNGFLFEVSNYYDWQTAKVGLGPSLAWTRKEYENVVDFINGCEMPVMPSIQSLGHMKWWLFNQKGAFPDLREDGCDDVLCTGNPKTYKLLFGLYDEDWSICSRNPKYIPKYFLTSLDEVRWKTNATPPEKCCKLCAGIPKNKIYLEHIKKLDKNIRSRGARMMMFTDMLVEQHNGLNEFKCSKILKDIPRDVIMCHWSSRDMPAIKKFKKMGFDNWKFATSYQESIVGEENTKGYCFNICTYNWWLSRNRCKSNGAYGLMAQAMFANNCWNSLPNDGSSAWQKNVRLYGNFLMRNWSRKPLLHASREIHAIDLKEVANKPLVGAHSLFDEGADFDLSRMDLKAKKIAGIPVRFAVKGGVAQGIVLNGEIEKVTIPLSKKVGSIILLHGAHLKKNSAKAFWRRLYYKDPLKGKNIAEYTVNYDDGTQSRFKILYGWNISEWRIDPLKLSDIFAKYIADSRSLWEGKTPHAVNSHLPNDIALYQYEWVNPYPNKKIDNIMLKKTEPYMAYALLAASFRGVK